MAAKPPENLRQPKPEARAPAVELLFYSVLLYAWQCLVPLPATGLALISLAGACWAVRGPGIKMLSPWPGSPALVAGGYPFELGANSVHTELPRRFVWAGPLVPAPRSRPLTGAGDWTTRGNAVVCGTRPFFSTVSKAHAGHLATFLGKLAEVPPDSRANVVDAELDAAFDLDACRHDFEQARRCTRPLRWICNVYAAVVFGLLPLLLIYRDQEAAWLAVFPAILALHASGVVALVLASRRMAESPSERFERALVGALYPPALLRASIDMVNDRLARFHSLTIASVVLDPRDLRRVLQVARADYAHPEWRRHQPYPVPEASERGAFLTQLQTRVIAVARQLEIDLRPVRRDPAAASVCPLCLFDYRPGFDRCEACGIPTQPFGS